MSGTDWAAIIGALAWLPQIGTWIYRAWAKPHLKLFPAPAPEVGYSAYGTVFNVPCAISASKKDAVVERMTAELTHENGQRIMLVWGGLNEVLSETESPTGEVERRRRQQTALALKVTTAGLVEKTVMFQDAEFQHRFLDEWRKVDERRERLDATLSNVGTALLQSDEFAGLAEVIQKGFRWQEGKYRVRINMHVAERRDPIVFDYDFVLMHLDFVRLRQNVATLDALARQNFDPQDAPKAIQWNWRYPSMLKA